MAVDQSEVESFIYSSLEKVKRSGNGFIARCPVCGDSKTNPNKRRLHIDFYNKYDEWVYTCYNGGCPNPSGNIQSLYAFVHGVTYLEADNILNNRKYDSDKLKKKLNSTGVNIVEEKDESRGVLDLDLSKCYRLTDKPDSLQGKKYIDILKKFIIERRIPTRYNPMICFDGVYENRIILPVYDDNELVYFQGRKIFDWMEPKYLNPVVVKENIILNKNNFDRDKFIIVTEGLTCAYNIGNQGTSCLGAAISDEVLEKLFQYTDIGVIIALDNPKKDKSGYKNYQKIIEGSKYAKRLKYFFMPGEIYKDINDMCMDNPLSFLPEVYKYVVENSISHFKANFLLKNLYIQHK